MPMPPMVPMMPPMPIMYPPFPVMYQSPIEASHGKPRNQVIERFYSGRRKDRENVQWTVDSRKLRSTDREAVSPIFSVSSKHGELEFKLVLKPKALDTLKGGSNFKNSRGKGYIELRCVSDLESDAAVATPTLTFRLGIWGKRKEPFRGPLRHDFRERAICGLPDGQDEWDFGKVVDHNNNTFSVIMELLKDDS
jgi:hypothetical protein